MRGTGKRSRKPSCDSSRAICPIGRRLPRLAAAYLGAPSSLTAEARSAALEEFSPEDIVAMMLKLTGWTWNKVRVSLGLHAPAEEGTLTAFEYDDGVAVLATRPS